MSLYSVPHEGLLRQHPWNSAGVAPTIRPKVLVKWLWLQKPVDKLISTRLAPAVRSIPLARSTRRSSTYRCGAHSPFEHSREVVQAQACDPRQLAERQLAA